MTIDEIYAAIEAESDPTKREALMVKLRAAQQVGADRADAEFNAKHPPLEEVKGLLERSRALRRSQEDA